MSYKKKISLVLLGIILMFPNLVLAQEINLYQNVESSLEDIVLEDNNSHNDSEVFRARVIEILEEREFNGQRQQNLKLKGLSGSFKKQEFEFQGIDDFQVDLTQEYQVGDKVMISVDQNLLGENMFYIIDFVRNDSIYILIAIFCLLILVIAKWKGLRALISLLLTFLIIIKIILPGILNGYNPILISIGGGFLILLFIIYITEGINKKSHLAVLSILISLGITGLLAVIFSNLMTLSGMSEDSVYLITLLGQEINFKGILLASVIIGTLGVLDDMVISQISIVSEIKKTNVDLTVKDVFKKAYRVGVSHISSMTNTLFLAYAGSSLTILLLFSVGAMNFTNVLNNHLVATEIFRSFIGAIGIVLAMPISTFLAVKYLKNKK
jgi:uncharacterized membrane protein